MLAYHPRFAGIRTFGHFFQRYTLYLAIVAIGVFGVTQNLTAQTVRPDEVGKDALWNVFTVDDSDDIVVEVGTPKTAKTTAVAALGGTTSNDVSTDTVASPLASSVENLAAVGSVDQAPSTTTREEVSTYTVQGGDTISTIAEQFGVSSRTILWANGLGGNDFIKPGQSLKIPSTSGYLYTVKSGDTLASIASKYKGKEDEILQANGIALAEAIQAGEEIIIPGGEPPAPPAAAPQPARTFLGIISGGTPPPSAPSAGTRFIWPTRSHRINQYYYGRRHTGDDIDGDLGDPIYAAASGRITYAGSDRSGYGLHVIIDHGNGFSTLYGHASRIYVQAGQSITQGQTIALQGCTGRCTGVHLHFEIRISGTPVNPLSYF